MWYSISLSFQADLLDIESDWQAVLLLSQCKFLPISMCRLIICHKVICLWSGIFSLRWLKSFLPLGSVRGGSAGILSYHSMLALLHLGNTTTSGDLGVECLQQSLDVSGKLCVSSSCINSSSSVHVSGRTCHRSTQNFDTGGTMLDGGSLTSHSSQHVGRHPLALSHLVVDVFVGHILRGLPYLHLTLWLLRDVCCTDMGSHLQSVRQWHGPLDYLQWKSTSNVGRSGQVGVLKRVYQTMPYLPLN